MNGRTAAGLTIYSVGHGNRTTEELIEMLKEAGVGRLYDVRRHPGSRRFPQFSRDALARSLAEAGIAYAWLGEELGGGGAPRGLQGTRLGGIRRFGRTPITWIPLRFGRR